MDFGSIEVQIFVSLVLVLGALFAALVCDFLKGNVEALRELNIELSVRQDERERHESRAVRQQHSSVAASPAVPRTHPTASASVPEESVPLVAPPSPARVVSTPPAAEKPATSVPAKELNNIVGEDTEETRQWATKDEQKQVEKLAGEIRQRVTWTTGDTLKCDAAPEEKEKTPSRDADRPVETRKTQVYRDNSKEASRGRSSLSDNETGLCVHAKVTPIDVVAAERAAASDALWLAKELERVADMSKSASPNGRAGQPPESPSSDVTVTGIATPPEASIPEDEFSIDSPIDEEEEPRDSQEAGAVAIEDGPATVTTVEESEASAPYLRLPTGSRDYSELDAVLAKDEKFRGTVVSLGVHRPDNASSMSGNEDTDGMIDGIEEFVESLLTAGDFACESGPNEYLLILKETDSLAQRRLQFISQRLWDYQIRSVASESVMFSWGSGEACGGSLAETIESAKEQMQQTRRNRQRVSSEIPSYHRRAAND